MTKHSEPQEKYPTNDQFWRAHQAMERPADLARRENATRAR